MGDPMGKAKREISYDEFLATVISAPCRTLSRCARPSAGEAAFEYDCDLTEFVRMPVYPVWFVNEARTEFRRYDHPEARAIRVEELAALDSLVRPELDSWYKADIGAIDKVAVIVLHCAGCGRRVRIDGVHRTLWLLNQRKSAALVYVTELSGSRWPVGTPDMDVVCTCTRGRP